MYKCKSSGMSRDVQPCGCKGVRSCALCENTDRVKKLRLEEDKYNNYEVFVYKQVLKKPVKCPELESTSCLDEIIKSKCFVVFFLYLQCRKHHQP